MLKQQKQKDSFLDKCQQTPILEVFCFPLGG